MSILAILLLMAVSAKSMSYEQARQQALFLTDKMAYELNLTDAQYEAAYEINLDYLMGVNTYDDLYGAYWRQRNLDLSYILLDWQYRNYVAAAYFYRPLYWQAGYWHFGIYARYPHRDYFFFYDRPRVYIEYRGGHSWRMNGGRSYYHGRHYGPRPGVKHVGMRDGFNRGDFGEGRRANFGNRKPALDQKNNQGNGNNSFGNRNGGFGNNKRTLQSNRPGTGFGNRESSTRTTVTQPNTNNQNRFGTRRNNTTTGPSSTFTPQRNPSQNNTARPSFGSGRNSKSVTRTMPSTPRNNNFATPRTSSPSSGSMRNSGSSFGSGRSSGSSFGGGSRNSAPRSNGSHGGFGSRR